MERRRRRESIVRERTTDEDVELEANVCNHGSIVCVCARHVYAAGNAFSINRVESKFDLLLNKLRVCVCVYTVGGSGGRRRHRRRPRVFSQQHRSILATGRTSATAKAKRETRRGQRLAAAAATLILRRV